jgi:hypothetical protein
VKPEIFYPNASPVLFQHRKRVSRRNPFSAHGHPPYQGGQGGSTPPLSRGAGGRTQITRFSITPKLIYLYYSCLKKSPEKGKREKNRGKSSPGEAADNSKTDVAVVAVVGVVPVTIRTATVPRIVVPRTAAQYTVSLICQ